MRVALITHGTRGDVQPLAAVAGLLARRGHDVVLGVPANLASFAQRLGLRVVPLTFDSAAVLDTPRGRKALAAGNFYALTRWLAALHHERSAELDADVLRACEGADLIVAGFLLEERAAAIAERLGVPLVMLHSQPLRRSRVAANALVRGASSRRGWLNLATHVLFERIWWGRLRADTNRFRRALGLADQALPISRRTLPAGQAEVQVYSQELVPGLAQEWSGNGRRLFSGFASLGPQDRALLAEDGCDDELSSWLDAGTPPVYFGFGSMPLLDPAATVTMISQVCGVLGVRALIVAAQPEAHAVGGLDPAQVRLAQVVDHDAVLPRMRAAVHHGGAGTLAASLGAGLPTMVCSFFVDQPFWGSQLERLGVGCHLRYTRLSHASLEAGVRRLLEPVTIWRAAELGQRLRAEPGGAGIIADLVDELLVARRVEPVG